MKAKALRSKYFILDDDKFVFGYQVLEVDEKFAYVAIDENLIESELSSGRFELCEQKRGRKPKDAPEGEE